MPLALVHWKHAHVDTSAVDVERSWRVADPTLQKLVARGLGQLLVRGVRIDGERACGRVHLVVREYMVQGRRGPRGVVSQLRRSRH